MGFDVELLVTFPCSRLDGVSALARRHLPTIRLEAECQDCPEAIAFLEEYAARTGPADSGPKNGLTAWTFGGNYTRPHVFAEVLRPYFDDLLRHPVEGGPIRVSHVVIIYQLQDHEQAAAIEVCLERPPFEEWEFEESWLKAPLRVRQIERLPFGWS